MYKAQSSRYQDSLGSKLTVPPVNYQTNFLSATLADQAVLTPRSYSITCDALQLNV